MKNVPDFIAILLGITVIIFNEFLAQFVVKFQNFLGFKFGNREINGSRVVIIICGIGAIIIGLLAIFGIIKPKQ